MHRADRLSGLLVEVREAAEAPIALEVPETALVAGQHPLVAAAGSRAILQRGGRADAAVGVVADVRREAVGAGVVRGGTAVPVERVAAAGVAIFDASAEAGLTTVVDLPADRLLVAVGDAAAAFAAHATFATGTAGATSPAVGVGDLHLGDADRGRVVAVVVRLLGFRHRRFALHALGARTVDEGQTLLPRLEGQTLTGVRSADGGLLALPALGFNLAGLTASEGERHPDQGGVEQGAHGHHAHLHIVPTPVKGRSCS